MESVDGLTKGGVWRRFANQPNLLPKQLMVPRGKPLQTTEKEAVKRLSTVIVNRSLLTEDTEVFMT